MCPDDDPESEEESETTKAIFLGDLVRGALSEKRKLTATLTAIAGPTAGRVYKIVPGENVLGRSADVHLVVEDEGVSRRHVRIVENADVHILMDLGSRNGTILNGERISSAPIVLK